MNLERIEWTSLFVFQIRFFFIFKAGTITSKWNAFHFQGSSILKNQKLNFEWCQDEYVCHTRDKNKTLWTTAHQASLSFTVTWSFSNSCPLSWWHHCNVMIHGLLKSDYNIEKNKHFCTSQITYLWHLMVLLCLRLVLENHRILNYLLSLYDKQDFICRFLSGFNYTITWKINNQYEVISNNQLTKVNKNSQVWCMYDACVNNWIKDFYINIQYINLN